MPTFIFTNPSSSTTSSTTALTLQQHQTSSSDDNTQTPPLDIQTFLDNVAAFQSLDYQIKSDCNVTVEEVKYFFDIHLSVCQ